MSSAAKSKNLFRGIGVVTAGNATGAVFGLVLLLLLARTLDPASVAIVLAVIAIIDGGQMFMDATINTGMINLATKNSAAGKTDPSILRAGLLAKAILASFVFLIFAIAGPTLSEAMVGDDQLAMVILVAGAAAGFAGMQSYVIGVLQAKEAFNKVAILSPLKNSLRVVVLLALIAIGEADPTTIALAICSVTVVAFLVSTTFLSWKFIGEGSHICQSLGALSQVNRWMVLVAFSMLAGRLDIWLVGYLGGAEQAGHYALAAQLCIGVGIVTQAIVATFLPKMSRFKAKQDFDQFLRQWVKFLPFMFVLPALAFLVSTPLITLVFGEAYAPAARVFDLLFLVANFTLFTAPLMLLLLAMNQARIVGSASVLQTLLRIGFSFWLIPAAGGFGMALSDLISRFVALFVVGFFIWSVLRNAIWTQDNAVPPSGEEGTARP